MKITFRNVLKVLLVCIIVVLKIIFSNVFNFIPLFLLEWPALVNTVLVVLFSCSTLRFEDYKIDSFLKTISIISIPLNIVVWIIALISFVNGTIDCNFGVFYALFGINAFFTITKIPSILKKDGRIENQNNQQKR